MSEAVQVASKVPVANKAAQSKKVQKPELLQSMDSPVDKIFFLQKTIGNKAVERLVYSGGMRSVGGNFPFSPAIMNSHKEYPFLQRVSFGNNATLSAGRQAIVGQAAKIAEKLVLSNEFRRKWEKFWKKTGKNIKPKLSLAQYQAAVRQRVVHDMDSTNRADVRKIVNEEISLPIERQTAGVTPINSRDTFLRGFAIDQGVDAVVSLLLHESLHGAGATMGPIMLYEPLFHAFEAEAGFPMMMGGADILDINQIRQNDTDMAVTFNYNLRQIGGENIPANLEIQVVFPETGQIVFDEQGGIRLPAKNTIPVKAGREKWVWHASNPGRILYGIRIIDPSTSTLLGSKQFRTNPRCVIGVSTKQCEDEEVPKEKSTTPPQSDKGGRIPTPAPAPGVFPPSPPPPTTKK